MYVDFCEQIFICHIMHLCWWCLLHHVHAWAGKHVNHNFAHDVHKTLIAQQITMHAAMLCTVIHHAQNKHGQKQSAYTQYVALYN